MASLMDSVKDMMTDAVVRKASSFLGLESSNMTSAIGKFLPAIIGGLINKGGNESGAGMLIDLIKSKNLNGIGVDDLLGVLGNKDQADSMLNTGGDLLGTIFGDNQGSVLDKLIGMSGLNKAGGSMLLKFLAPIVLRKIGGMVMKNGWGASKLSSYMNEQKSSIAGLVSGIPGLVGFAESATASGNEGIKKASAKASAIVESVSTDEVENSGGGWWKWLLPLILLGGIIWFLTKDGCNDTAENDNTEMTSDDSGSMDNQTAGSLSSGTNDSDNSRSSSETLDTSTEGDLTSATITDNGDIVDANGQVIYRGGEYGLDGNGNLVGNSGNVLVKSENVPTSLLERLRAYLGQYAGNKLTVDKDGNLVDGSGKIIFTKGEYSEKDGFYYDKDGNKLGRIWGKIVQAVKETAEAGIDAMKELFSGLATKKSGAKTSYALSNIKFDESGSRITSFSKNEVEGLAAALKENESGKIVVRAYTNDGKNDRENKNMSKDRAQVVHDMLVTLGVDKKQISVKGMGEGENRVEITASE